MSLPAQPQQPVQNYPSPFTNQPSHHHSDGTFGTVFIVLAIILVISVVACFLGRLCNKRYNKHNHSQRPPIHNLHPRERDIEFGVDKRGTMLDNNEKRMPPPIIAMPKGHRHGASSTGGGPQVAPMNDNMRDFEMKPGHDEGELRAGP